MAYKHILHRGRSLPGKQSSGRESSLYGSPLQCESFSDPRRCKLTISDLYTGLIDVNLGDMQKRISEETHHALTELSTNAGYPITETLKRQRRSGPGTGRCNQEIRYGSGGLWSPPGLLEQTDVSPARQLINTVHVDMLIVPLRDEEE